MYCNIEKGEKGLVIDEKDVFEIARTSIESVCLLKCVNTVVHDCTYSNIMYIHAIRINSINSVTDAKFHCHELQAEVGTISLICRKTFSKR